MQLIPFIYPHVGPRSQPELIQAYGDIAQDESPIVRKQAAISLRDMADPGSFVPDNELLGILTRFFQDSQDSVRMHVMETCVSYARRLTVFKIEQCILPQINWFAKDRSWRIRYTVMDQMVPLAKQIGHEKTQNVLVP